MSLSLMIISLVWLGLVLVCLLLHNLFLFVLKLIALNSNFPPVFVICSKCTRLVETTLHLIKILTGSDHQEAQYPSGPVSTLRRHLEEERHSRNRRTSPRVKLGASLAECCPLQRTALSRQPHQSELIRQNLSKIRNHHSID